MSLLFYRELKEKLKEEIESIRKDHPEFKPGLAIVQVWMLFYLRLDSGEFHNDVIMATSFYIMVIRQSTV